MKTALIISGILSVGGAISAFTWVPSAADSTREWMNKPAIEAVRTLQADNKQTMAGMKHFDIYTDNLVDEIRDIRGNISRLERELNRVNSVANSSGRETQSILFLKSQLKMEREKLQKQLRLLDGANIQDQRILSELSGILS